MNDLGLYSCRKVSIHNIFLIKMIISEYWIHLHKSSYHKHRCRKNYWKYVFQNETPLSDRNAGAFYLYFLLFHGFPLTLFIYITLKPTMITYFLLRETKRLLLTNISLTKSFFTFYRKFAVAIFQEWLQLQLTKLISLT